MGNYQNHAIVKAPFVTITIAILIGGVALGYVLHPSVSSLYDQQGLYTELAEPQSTKLSIYSV